MDSTIIDVENQDRNNLNQLANINAETYDRVAELAKIIGYDGTLSIAAVEDEIKFYMRRTVEDCLELGMRLLVLKELTSHGNSSQIGTNQDFDSRLEQLGFARSAAYRFMNATKRATKNATVAFLSTQAKNVTAFLEMVTMDDDELKAIAELDDIDRMSASELRSVLRKAKGEADADKSATDKVLANKSAEITKLQKQLAKQNVALTDWPAQFSGYIAQAQEAHRAVQNKLGALDIIREEAMKLEAAEGEESALQQAREMLATELVHIHNSCADIVEAIGLSFDRTLGAFSDERLNAFTVPTE